ncbi:MAG: LD-carboxypeptidase [Alphaproteobacteria bacterium]|nr:LD-carboxypeptidase [Alphaproteobacteria bacterium]
MVTHIHMIAPSYPVSLEDVQFAKQHLESLGLQVTIPPDLLGADLLCANHDEARLSHLKAALADPGADVIWLLQGGYGLTRLIPDLFFMEKPCKEKLFIGFSDGTALHVFLNQAWNWPSIHGAGALHITKQKVGAQTIEMTLHLLKEGQHSYSLPFLNPVNDKAREMSSLTGTLIGGNLCLLTCSLGTDWQINASEKILFLEDIDERGYRVDRMLVHLQQASIFNTVKAIIFGDFVGGNEANGASLIPQVLERFSNTIHVPVFRLHGCGHGKENIPLPFNKNLDFSINLP